MKDVSKIIRSEIFKRLNGYIGTVPVFVGNLPENNHPYRYVNILSQISSNISGKQCPITDQTVNIEVVVNTSQGFNRNEVDYITNAVMVRMSDFYFNNDEFHLCECEMESIQDLGVEFNGVDKTNRKVIIFDIKVDEHE